MSGFEFDLESTFQVLFQLFFCALTFLWPYFFETDNPKNDFEHRFKANIEKLKRLISVVGTLQGLLWHGF